MLAEDNAPLVGLLGGSDCLIASHLLEVCAFLEGKQTLRQPPPEGMMAPASCEDLSDVIGQLQGKRALEITASGGHNLLLVGSPGYG